MNIEILAEKIVPKISRYNTAELEKILRHCIKSENEINIELASILPSSRETSIQKEEHRFFLKHLANYIFIKNHRTEHSDSEIDEAISMTNAVRRHIKKSRKSAATLYTKAVKTNLTEDEYFHLIEVMNSYRYSSASAFLRDLIAHKLDVKPSNSSQIEVYFENTKQISDSLSELVEQDTLVTEENREQFMQTIKKLERNLLNTRNLAIDAHNAQTASHLAKKYLDSQCLYTLYLDKLAEENR